LQKTVWPTKPKIFTVWPFTEIVFQLLPSPEGTARQMICFGRKQTFGYGKLGIETIFVKRLTTQGYSYILVREEIQYNIKNQI